MTECEICGWKLEYLGSIKRCFDGIQSLNWLCSNCKIIYFKFVDDYKNVEIK